jgi:hypothetical protein
MPPHKASGTPKKKNRKCLLCDARPRSGKAWKLHHKTEHGIDDMKEFYRVQFERHSMGLDSIYRRDTECQ